MKTIPYGHQWIDSSDIKEVIKVLKSDFITQGPKIEEFENALCKYTGSKYAVVVSSGTAALHIACLAAGIKIGDEVITSPITFLASANCILYCGAVPVFSDIEEYTANIDPTKLDKNISKRTKAIIPVHFAGHPCDLRAVRKTAKKYGLMVIEDAAHSLGAKYKDSKIGSCKYSDMTILSFHPVKHITTGEGGAVLTNNKSLYDNLIMLRTHGVTKKKFKNASPGGWYYEMKLLGYNYRLTDIQAALGISQLKRIEYFVKRRRNIAQRYNEAFLDNPYFSTPIEKDYAYSSYHLYPLRLKKEYISMRSRIFNGLRKFGIGVQVHYIPVYLQHYFSGLGFKKGLCPKAEDFYDSEISIPLYPAMTDKDINKVISAVLQFS